MKLIYIFFSILFLGKYFSNNKSLEDKKIFKDVINELDFFLKKMKRRIISSNNLDYIFQSWENNYEREEISVLKENIKINNIKINDFNEILKKSLNVSEKFLSLKFKVKELELAIVKNILDCLNIQVQYSIDNNQSKINSMANIEKTREEFFGINSDFSPIKSIQLIPNLVNIYLQFQELRIQKKELKRNMFYKIINLSNDLMKKRLEIIKFYIKIKNSRDKLIVFFKNKEFLKTKEFLQSMNKSFKYIQKYIEIIEKINELNYQIILLTGNRTLKNKSNLLIATDDEDNEKILNIFPEIKDLKKCSQIVKYYNKVFDVDFKLNIKRQYLANLANSVLSILAINLSLGYKESKKELLNQKDKIKSNEIYSQSFGISSSLMGLTNLIFSSIKNNLEYEKKSSEIKEKILNWGLQIKENTYRIQCLERKIDLKNKEIELLEQECNEKKKRLEFGLTSSIEFSEIRTKLLSKKINRIILFNELNKFKILILYENQKTKFKEKTII